MIAIVDYGLGNVQAFKDVYNRLNMPVLIARSSKDLVNVTKLILPGVGSFDYAIMKLDESGMRKNIEDLVIDKKIPILGVCVGMQMLARSSEEGKLKGLEWIDAIVKRFDSTNGIILPHMGWNNVNPRSYGGLYKNTKKDLKFYFLHEYYFDACEESDIEATANYEGEYVCSVRKGNIFGVQFHPEKSHHFGMQLLKNFAEI
jgi:imidazole glycerol-phosphate synthase subunit HisH